MGKGVERLYHFLFLFLSPMVFAACVGPTTPFGAIGIHSQTEKPKVINDDEQMRKLATVERFQPQLHFYPKRQVLHGKTKFAVEVIDHTPIHDNSQLQIFYNNIDVTAEFLKNSHISTTLNGKRRRYEFNDLRLKSAVGSEIRVRYKNHRSKMVEASYLPPRCSLFRRRSLASIDEFKPAVDYVELIREVAASASYNPAFLAGIVAQESGFNSKAVSWAKAIGLTQITPLAEKEIIQNYENWPRYPGINKLSYLKLKSKIVLGEISPETEWRLSPKKSLQGGTAYLKYLYNYWNLENNKKLVESLPGNKEINLSEVILASYNSGAYRVKKAVIELDSNWKTHKKLKEASRYVRRVSSYCYHYSQGEEENDSET